MNRRLPLRSGICFARGAELRYQIKPDFGELLLGQLLGVELNRIEFVQVNRGWLL